MNKQSSTDKAFFAQVDKAFEGIAIKEQKINITYNIGAVFADDCKAELIIHFNKNNKGADL